MDDRIRRTLREAYETGYADALRDVAKGELVEPISAAEVLAAVEGRSAEWISELDRLDRGAAA